MSVDLKQDRGLLPIDWRCRIAWHNEEIRHVGWSVMCSRMQPEQDLKRIGQRTWLVESEGLMKKGRFPCRQKKH